MNERGNHRAALIVHGGAGLFREEKRVAALGGVRDAAELGQRLLAEGRTALDVAEAVVKMLEDNPVYDAGRGSFPNAAGEVEMDALIVDGTTRNFGAVAAIRNVANPISVARSVMTRTEHCMLAGEGATRFAQEQGFPFVPDVELAGDGGGGPDRGTVGAAVLDGNGQIVSATSTGGTRGKLAGRVGDSPLIGCGGIAVDGVGGVSCTGYGEAIMRVQLARSVLDRIRQGLPAQEAAEAAMEDLEGIPNGRAGIICVDAAGRIGLTHSTEHLAAAWWSGDREVLTQLKS